MKKMINKRGFTLVELLVVIVILGIITGMSYPLIRRIIVAQENKKYTTFQESVGTSAKLFVDSYSEDLFGHQKSGCAYITYSDLKKRGLYKDIQMSDISCETDDTYVKVIKVNDKYSYSPYIGCGKKAAKVTATKKVPELRPPKDDNCGIGKTTITIEGNPSSSITNDKKRLNINLRIKSTTGIAQNPIISYAWSENNDKDKVNGIKTWTKLKANIPTTKEQNDIIFTQNKMVETDNNITTQDGYTGDIYLVVKVERLKDLAMIDYSGSEYIYLGPYKLDNEPPKFNDSKIVSSKSGFNDLQPKLEFKASDNFTLEKDLRMCVSYDKNTCKTTPSEIKKYKKYDKNAVLDKISTKFDGSTHKIYVTIADRAGNYTTKDFSYRVTKKNTIKFNANGGKECSPPTQEYVENTKATSLCTTTRAGYNFTGWNTSKDGKGTTVNKDTIVNKDMTVYAQWTLATYTISYNLDGGSVSGNPTSYTINTSDFTLKNPTKTGHTFAGWTGTSLNSKTKTVTVKKGSSGNRSYKANWTINKYKLTFDSNGGSTCSPSSIEQEYNKAWGTLCTPAKKGNNFEGWYTSKTGGTKITNTSKATSNMTVYARWTLGKYKITYNLNKGTVSGNPTEYTVESNDITLKNPTRPGSDFLGWTGTGLSSNTKTVTIKKGSTGNRTYTANWNVQKYSLSYNGNGNTGGATGKSTCEYDTDCPLRSNGFTKTGHTFAGWYTSASGGSKYGTTTRITKDTTVYAHWNAIQYTLTYNSDGGSACGSITRSYNQTWGTLCTPTRTGYTFGGWYTGRNGGGTKITSSSTATSNITVYAKWTVADYTITYNLNGGTVSGNPTKYTINTADFTLKNPTKTGHTFAGWTGTGLSGNTKTVTVRKGSSGNRSYTANWTPNQYTLTYNGNGNTGGSTAATTCSYNQSCTLRSNGFTKSGYTFDGWYTAASGGSKYGSTTKITANTTVYAHWKATPPTCSISLEGKTGSNGWYTESGVKVKMTVTGSPTTKGLATTANSTNGKLSATASKEGTTTYYGYVKNAAGSATCQKTVKIDTEKPTCTHDGWSTTWTSSNRTIKWGCSDDTSRCDSNYNGGSRKFDTSTKTANISSYTIKDNAGNSRTCAAKTANVYVDRDPPKITSVTRHCGVWSPGGQSSDKWYIKVVSKDAHSGIAKRTISYIRVKNQTDTFNNIATLEDHLGYNTNTIWYDISQLCDRVGHCINPPRNELTKPAKCK